MSIVTSQQSLAAVLSSGAAQPLRLAHHGVARRHALARHPGMGLAAGLLALALAGCGGGGAGAPATAGAAPSPAPVEAPAAPAPAPAPTVAPAPGTGQAADQTLVREAQAQTEAFLGELQKMAVAAPADSGRAAFIQYQQRSAESLKAELTANPDQAQALAASARIVAMKLDTELWLEAERRVGGQAQLTSTDLGAVASVVRVFDVWGIAQLPPQGATREFSVGEVSSLSAALRMVADSARQGKVDVNALRDALNALRLTPLPQPVAFVPPPVVDLPPLKVISSVPSMNAPSDAPHPWAGAAMPTPSPSPAPSPGTPSTPGATQLDSVRVSVTARPAEVTFPPGSPDFADTSVVPEAGLLSGAEIAMIRDTFAAWRLTPQTTCPNSFVSGSLDPLPYDWRIGRGASLHTMDMIENRYVAGSNPTNSTRTLTNILQGGYPFQSFVNIAIAGPADVASFLETVRKNITTCTQVVDDTLVAFGVDSRANSDGRRHWTLTMGRPWPNP